MADLATSAAAASLIVGLMTIPAASTTVDSSATVSEQLPDISSSNQTPTEYTRATNSTGFRASIETAFDRFSVETSSDTAETELEQPTTKLHVKKTPSSTIWTLTTSQGELKVEKSSTQVTQTVKTPEGTLRIRDTGNGEKQSFNGEDKTEVLSSYHELRELMKQKKQQIDDKRNQLEQRSLPEVTVKANKSAASGFGNNTEEFAKIVNNDVSTVNLKDWKLSDDTSSFDLPETTLEPGQEIKVYTEAKENLEIDEETAIYDSGLAWNDDGDIAELKNVEGQEVDEKSY